MFILKITKIPAFHNAEYTKQKFSPLGHENSLGYNSTDFAAFFFIVEILSCKIQKYAEIA
jgi:hypothetical protein